MQTFRAHLRPWMQLVLLLSATDEFKTMLFVMLNSWEVETANHTKFLLYGAIKITKLK